MALTAETLLAPVGEETTLVSEPHSTDTHSTFQAALTAEHSIALYLPFSYIMKDALELRTFHKYKNEPISRNWMLII